MSFQQRFKSKLSKLTKNGEININSESAISKPSKSQIHSPISRSIANSVQDYPKKHTSQKPSVSHLPQLKPIPSKSPPIILRQQNFHYPRGNNLSTFIPYSLKDYRLIRPNKYYVLGGVGPAHVGSSEWMGKMKLLSRRKRYGQDVNGNNLRRVCKSTELYSGKGEEVKKIGYLEEEEEFRMFVRNNLIE